LREWSNRGRSRFPTKDLTNEADFSRWMFILFPDQGAGTEFNPTQDEYLKCVKDMIGDDSLDVEILGVSKWFINEIVAEYYSDGNMYGLPIVERWKKC
jgi:hypothetical protein